MDKLITSPILTWLTFISDIREYLCTSLYRKKSIRTCLKRTLRFGPFPSLQCENMNRGHPEKILRQILKLANHKSRSKRWNWHNYTQSQFKNHFLTASGLAGIKASSDEILNNPKYGRRPLISRQTVLSEWIAVSVIWQSIQEKDLSRVNATLSPLKQNWEWL